MDEQLRKKLLKNAAVVEEIKRHLWIESEKAGRDIGFERAAEDWMTKFAQAWADYHLPSKKSSDTKAGAKKKTASSPGKGSVPKNGSLKPRTGVKKSAAKKASAPTAVKRRSAKKYTL